MPDQNTLGLKTEKPDLNLLNDEFTRAGGGVAYWRQANEQRRLMVWKGQTVDGKKHRQALGEEPFPWEGASDTRVPLVDGIINELTAVNLASMSRAQLKVVPTEWNDTALAGQLEQVLGYFRRLLRKELRREGELISQYGNGDGTTIWQVGWDCQYALQRKSITLEQIQQMQETLAQQTGQRPQVDAVAVIRDPALEDVAVRYAQDLIPQLKTGKEARAFVRRLREEGMAEWDEPYKVRNQPAITARRLGYDIFLPADTTDLQSASAIFVVEWLTEAQVRVRALVEGWPDDFRDAVLKTVGKVSSWSYQDDAIEQVKAQDSLYLVQDSRDRRYEVLYAYTKPADEEGHTGVWLTVFSPHVARTPQDRELYGVHERQDYLGDVYPFVPYKREHYGRRLTASRGVAEVAFTWQNELKTQRDMLADRAAIEINPTLRVPKRMGQQYRTGPGIQIQARDGEVGSLDPVKGSPQLAFELMRVLEKQSADYFNLMHPDVLPVKWQMGLQIAADRFLASVEEVFGIVLLLVLSPELMPRDELERITGVALGGDLSREAVARKFDTQVVYDVRDLDMDWVMKKLEIFAETVLPLDRGGLVDANKLVGIVANSVDPQLAQALVQSPGEASQRLFKQVEDDVAQMFLGNERQYVEEDPTAATKLQFLQSIVQANPTYQQALADKESRFAQLMENYVKNLTMSVQQTMVNPRIGRTGVQAVGAG